MPGLAGFTTGKLAAIITAAGGFIFASGLFFPAYKNPELAGRIKLAACGLDGRYRSGWNDELLPLLTWRYPLMQGGASLVLAGVVLLLLVKMFPDRDRRWPTTPVLRRTYFVLGFCALAVGWVGFVVSIVLDVRRGDYVPLCADSAGIPIISATIGYPIIAAISATVGAVLMIGFGRLPASLWQWDANRTARSWIVTTIAGVGIAGLGLIIANTAVDTLFMATPAHIIMIYLVASARSALLSPREAGSSVPVPRRCEP